MKSVTSLIAQKAYRAGEFIDLCVRYAAGADTRRTMLHIYRSLSQRERYDDIVHLTLRIKGRAFPIRMRISDIFVVGEILHEQQYRLESRLPDDATIVDLGANIGISVVWFLAQCPGAHVHAFEPAPDNLRFLEHNVEGLSHVTLQRAAVGNRSGSAMLHHGEFGGMHSLLIDGGGVTVPLLSLADYMQQQGISRIDLLKLDIEGSELDALKGLGERIRDVNVIVGEVHEAIVDEAAFYRFLEEHGFRVLWKKFFRESREQQVHGFEAARIDPIRTPRRR